VVVNRLRASLAGLSAVILAGWPELFGEEVIVVKITI